MDVIHGTLTIRFEDPFYIGLYERQEGTRYSVCRIVFGAEPKDEAVYAFLLAHWDEMTFSPAIAAEVTEPQRMNPKRMQREVRRQLAHKSGSTKAQQALKAQQEQRQAERQARARLRREEKEERAYLLRQQKRREKHLGH